MSQKKQKKILFVSHKANRSGAPILLLELIKGFKKHSDIPFEILILNDGELVKEFALLGKTYTWDKKKVNRSSSFPQNIVGAISRILFIIKSFYTLFRLRKTSLVFFNSVASGHFHKKVLFLKCTYIYFIHELEAAIHMLTNKESLQLILTKTDLFVAGSNAVKENLINNYEIDESIVKVLPYSFSGITKTTESLHEFISTFKNVNNIPAESILIGAVGPNEWRKGFDLFFPLITLYFNLFPESDAHFIWKGFDKKNASAFFDQYDYKKFKYPEKIILLPHGNDSLELMACLDIHLLLSREDPYPLVLLDAASLAIPTICFLEAGGSPEFVEEDCGYALPYGDLMKMAKKINVLAETTDLRKKMGAKAREKLRLRHDPKTTMPAFVELLDSNS